MDDIYLEYMEQKREDYAFRDERKCIFCGHLGKEHDSDEVGECQACGCSTFGYIS